MYLECRIDLVCEHLNVKRILSLRPSENYFGTQALLQVMVTEKYTSSPTYHATTKLLPRASKRIAEK